MKNNLDNERQSVNYLLGEMSGDERDLFEERLFADENLSLLLNAAENDLIDEYLRGELAPVEKQKFEAVYLTTETRRERVRTAQILNAKLFDEKEPVTETRVPLWQSLKDFFRVPIPVLAGGLALILLALLGGFWILNRPSSESDLARDDNKNQPIIAPPQTVSPIENNSNVNNSSEDNEKLSDKNTNLQLPNKREITPPQPAANKPDKNQKPQTVSPPPRVFAFSLMPPLRSSETPVLKIPPSAETVRLRLFDNFGRVYEKFLIELNGGSGDTIWSRQITASKKRPQRLIVVSIPNKQFKSGNYEIAVNGITKEGSVEEINFYNFVVKKDKD